MSRTWTCFVFALLILSATNSRAGILFADHFDDASSLTNWNVKHGNASVENQRLALQGSGSPRDSIALINGNPQWKDLSLSVNVQPLAGWHDSRIFFRTQDFDWSSGGTFGKGYILELEKATGQGPWDIVSGETAQFDQATIQRQDCPATISCSSHVVAVAPINPPLYAPVDANIVVVEGTIRVFLNGKEYLEYTDPIPLPAGGVGLGAIWETLATFDDLVIKDVAMPFAAFTPRLSASLGPKSADDSFETTTAFALGTDSNGVDPLHEAVRLQVGSYSVNIPAGAFRRQAPDKVRFRGTIDKVYLVVDIYALGHDRYLCWAKGQGANLEATTLAPTVSLSIGDDEGVAKLPVGKAKFGTAKEGKWVSTSP